MESDPTNPKRSMLFDFDVKFSFDISTNQLTFELNSTKSTYSLKSDQVLK